MKYILFTLALLAVTTSCEKRSTSFDPDEQLVSHDEFAQIAVWDQLQTDRLTNAEYERINALEFVRAKYEYRQNFRGKWVIEGSVTNTASEVHFENVQLVLSFYNDENTLIGAENYVLQDRLAPGDQSGFYFKSEKYDDAYSMDVAVVNVKPVS
ncbi:MAG: FxLYD domain-containing protein [Crocinitomicaceae bacterium]